jgi:hypothetical protein
MADKPHNISLAEVEDAVKNAVNQLQQHRAQLSAPGRPTVMGKWLRDVELPTAEAEAAAEQITKASGPRFPA